MTQPEHPQRVVDLKTERARRISAIEAAQVEAGLREVLRLRDCGALTDDELLGIWGRGL